MTDNQPDAGRVCVECERRLTTESFTLFAQENPAHSAVCRSCLLKIVRWQKPVNRRVEHGTLGLSGGVYFWQPGNAPAALDWVMSSTRGAAPRKGTRCCSECTRWLPVEAFGKSRYYDDGIAAWCKECGKRRIPGSHELDTRYLTPPLQSLASWWGDWKVAMKQARPGFTDEQLNDAVQSLYNSPDAVLAREGFATYAKKARTLRAEAALSRNAARASSGEVAREFEHDAVDADEQAEKYLHIAHQFALGELVWSEEDRARVLASAPVYLAK